MAYETVFKISRDMLEDGFLRESDLEKLTKYNVVYFLRKNNIKLENNFFYTGVTGPHENQPIINSLESKTEVIKRFIPKDQMPSRFEQVEFAGLTIDYTDFIRSNLIACEHSNSIIKSAFDISSEIFEKIKSDGKDISDMFSAEYDMILKSSTHDYILEFKRRKFPKLAITLNIFGKAGPDTELIFTPRFLMADLGLNRLVTMGFGDLAIETSHHHMDGMAYNLSLEKKDISQILDCENVVI